jgi:hypothetical protein
MALRRLGDRAFGRSYRSDLDAKLFKLPFPGEAAGAFLYFH